jgi:3D-(3,5/4)-trihydroxycyclohexane-1,2-dione acylhydrolase (decyclizing)
VLFLPGDVFANRAPDPVLQQVEDFGDGTISANDCFRPVSRYFDRISRPEHVIPALNRAITVLTDPAECGPVTLAFCQDVQAQAYDYPESFFAPRLHRQRRAPPDAHELDDAIKLLTAAKKPYIIAGGGVLYSGAEATLQTFAKKHGIPVAETHAGKSSIPHDHAFALGALGVTGTSAANSLADDADVILAVGTRLADFVTGSWSMFRNPKRKIIALNVQAFDAAKHRAQMLVADARTGLEALDAALGDWRAPAKWQARVPAAKAAWIKEAAPFTATTNSALPSDAQVIGALQRLSQPSDIMVGAAGGLPGEMHKLWNPSDAMGYHFEYGYSTMGYEIAGSLGVKMAHPDREVIVTIGDGSYLMMNSEIAAAVMLGLKLIIVLNDNRGYGCINRLQLATGGASFNNLLQTSRHEAMPNVDFVKHAASLGATAVKVGGIGDFEAALTKARKGKGVQVIVMDTDPMISTSAGGNWWDVAVPEVSSRKQVRDARKKYDKAILAQRIGD